MTDGMESKNPDKFYVEEIVRAIGSLNDDKLLTTLSSRVFKTL